MILQWHRDVGWSLSVTPETPREDMGVIYGSNEQSLEIQELMPPVPGRQGKGSKVVLEIGPSLFHMVAQCGTLA